MIRSNFYITLSILLIGFGTSYGQSSITDFGAIHVDAPDALADYEEMIGSCDCKSLQRNPDGTWQDTIKMVWNFKYILNGLAVQDETWKSDGTYATSIRQYNTDSLKWMVTYFASGSAPYNLPTWAGRRKDNVIELTRPQIAPNGMEGYSKLTFYDIASTGFKWKGEWIKNDQSVVYPFWYIDCIKTTPLE